MADGTQQTESGLADIESGGGNQRISGSDKRLLAILVAVVCLVVISVYWPVLSSKAFCFDDDAYFFQNPLVRNPGWESARRFLTEVHRPSIVRGYYQPLTMISLMLDYSLVGPTDDITQFHRTSLALHTANTALIIVLLYLLFGRVWIAAAVGLLFGLHPMTVETITWVGERKTVLAAFFALWSLVFYVRFVRDGRRKFFAWSLVMYVLALMSKPTSTPLPAMLLLMDYWPLRRLKIKTVLEKVPFFVVGVISAFITYISQSASAGVVLPQQYGGMARIPLVICHNIVFYLFKMVWPVNLTSHTPFPEPLNLSQPMVLAGVIGTCVLVLVLIVSLRWTRGALTGGLIFFIMILPTTQAIQFSDVILSHKFAYLPSSGLLMALAAFVGWILGSRRWIAGLTARGAVIGVVVLVLATGEAVATRKYVACWRDSVSLWGHMVEVTPRAISPRVNFGVSLAQAGDSDGAMEQLKIALQINPNDGSAHYNIGKILAERGQHDRAKKYYEKALELQPKNPDVYNALAVMLVSEGKLEEAAEMYRKAIVEEVEMSFLMHGGLGCVLMQMGKVDEAIKELEIAVRMKADSPMFCNLGMALASKGENDKAMECYKKAIMMDPNNAEAHYDLGTEFLSRSRLVEATGEFKKAIKAKPNYVKAYGNLAVTFAQMGLLDKAMEGFRRAVEIEPNNPDARFNLASALADRGLVDEAVEHLQMAIEASPADIGAKCKLAELLLRQGNVEQAVAEYEQVLEIDPNNGEARRGLLKARADAPTRQ